MTVDASILFAAQEAHRAGKVAEAEAGYAKWLRAYPNEANGLHFLGLLKFQTERLDAGVALVRESLKFDDRNAHAWNNLAICWWCRIIRKKPRKPINMRPSTRRR